MLAPKLDFINIDVVYLTYNPERNSSNPSLEYEGNTLAGLPDLHDHYVQTRQNRNIMIMPTYKQSIWYNSVLQEEMHEAPSGYKLQVFHWKIESGIRDAFRIKNMEFDKVTMIIGANTEYWYGVNTSPTTGFTKRGRYARPLASESKIPNVRHNVRSLPQCPIIWTSCNATTSNVCNCFAKMFLSGQCLTNMNCELTLEKLNELAGIVGQSGGDTDDDGLMQDILLFRIYMSKCSRDDILKSKKDQSEGCKYNFKTKKYRGLKPITESEDEL